MAETVFITRYALTDGVYELPVVKDEIDGKSVTVKFNGRPAFFWGNDWHRTRAEAEADAERRRTLKIASHNKSIAKLEGMIIKFKGLPEAAP